jgi:26S proteasome regulatory subunit T1
MSSMSSRSPNLVVSRHFKSDDVVVNLGDRVSPTDIEEGMRVGVDRQKYSIQLPLPPKIDPSVTMMQVEDKPDVTYSDVGGCKEQIERLREVVEVPLLSV